MTSKLKCPFCQTELEDAGIHSAELYFCCTNCYMKQKEKDDNYTASPRIWQALIQSQKDLGIARQALKDTKKVCDGCRWCDSNLYDPTPSDGRRIAETINKALEQIEHKE